MACSSLTADQIFDADKVVVDGITLSSTNITAGQTVTATATVSNGNDATAGVEVTFTLDGTDHGTRSTQVLANGTTTIAMDVLVTNPGNHDICADVTAAWLPF